MARRRGQSRLRRLWPWLRGDARRPPADLPAPEPAVPHQGRVGICCSGGGIRSAAYSLGGLGVLRDAGLFRCSDPAKHPVVSAVSGGSYIAASFATVATSLAPHAEPDVYAANSPEERHLRNNSSYMAAGFGGKVRLLARVLLGMIPNLALVGLSVYFVGWLLGALWAVAVPDLGKHAQDLDTGTWAKIAGAAAVAAVAIVLPDLLFRVRDTVSARMQTWSIRALIVALTIFVVLVALPHLVDWLRTSRDTWLRDLSDSLPFSPKDKATLDVLKQLNVVAVLGTMLSAAWTFIARRGKLVALAVGSVSGPLAVGIPVVLVAEKISSGGVSGAERSALAGAAAFAALTWVFVDLNQWSLNPFYRRRLSSAFFVERDGRNVRERPFRHRLRFSELRTGDRFPQLVVCAAANVSDVGVTPPGRRATPFRFSSAGIGGPLVTTRHAAEYERKAALLGRDATLPAAVSVSGAAVSPTMGKKTLRAFTILLTLTNVRLGVWLPNPRYLPSGDPKPTWRARALAPLHKHVARETFGHWLDWLGARRPGPHYLFKEMFGRTSITDRFLYVSDGGHYDNLGLVELLRDGCTTIFCLDGGGDRAGSYQALGEAVALARSELGVDIEVDPLVIASKKKKEFAPTDHVIGRIRYRGTTGEAPLDGEAGDEGTGLLVYCRAAVTADAPWDVRDFRDRDPRFPIHSTLDQLFNDQKFESYRALGAWTARRALTTWQRRVVLDAIRRELVDRARRRTWVRHEELMRAVMTDLRAQFGLGHDPAWAPANLFPTLLDEIKASEETAKRPALALLVQERQPGRLVKRTLTPVWDYWAPAGPNGTG